MCSYMDKQKEAADHYKLYDNGTLAKYDRKGFSADSIIIAESADENQTSAEGEKKFLIQIERGRYVEDPAGNYLWDSAEKCDPQKISTGKTYRAYYKVHYD